MGSRYIISGVQLGMLVAIDNLNRRQEVAEKIMDKQFVGHTTDETKKDVKWWGRTY